MSVVMLNVTNSSFMLSVIMLNVIMLNVKMLNVTFHPFMLSVTMLSVIILSVVAPKGLVNGTARFKNVKNCLNTNI